MQSTIAEEVLGAVICLSPFHTFQALGGASGGFVAGSKELVEVLRRHSKSYVYSAAIPAPSAAAALKALELLQRDSSLLSKLHQNTKDFRRGMAKLGFEVKGSDHPICPVMIRDDMATWKIADQMTRFQHDECVAQLKLYTLDKLSGTIFCCLCVCE